MEILRHFFSGDYMPHGFCYLWNPALVWLHVISDSLIAASYLSIPITLIYLTRERRDVPFHWMFVCFGAFIVACGGTHFMEAWNIWHADYGIAGIVKAITAVASVSTAILLVRLVPAALALPSSDDLNRMNGMLAQQKFELARSNSQLEAANRELEAFCYSVSHDLRAPLRGIDGFSQALLEDYSKDLDETGRQHLERVRAAAQRMSALIDDLLQLSRITRTEIERQRVDLSEMARAVVQDLARLNKDRTVEFVIAPGLEAEADPRLMRTVLENLLGNAWKFTSRSPSARIEFGRTQANGESAFFVRDNGAGFDSAYAGRLFGAFQRLHAATEFPGTGVGLASVQRIIHRHGGHLWAEGAVNQGATFFFTLLAASRAPEKRQPSLVSGTLFLDPF
jgi:signal transduction histidine kinase